MVVYNAEIGVHNRNLVETQSDTKIDVQASDARYDDHNVRMLGSIDVSRG